MAETTCLSPLFVFAVDSSASPVVVCVVGGVRGWGRRQERQRDGKS